MPDFLESPRFPGCPSFGFTSDPEYRVVITRRSSGVEKRNRAWSRPLSKMIVTIGPRHQSEIQELLEFWHAVGGQAIGFRVKDWTDFQSSAVGITPSALDQPLVQSTDSPENWQLTKRYQFGALTQDREIYKPVQGTILIADNGTLKTETTHYTVDYTSGIVDLLFTPTGTMTWGGEFDLPMRFDSGFPVEIANQNIESVQFALQELRLVAGAE